MGEINHSGTASFIFIGICEKSGYLFFLFLEVDFFAVPLFLAVPLLFLEVPVLLVEALALLAGIFNVAPARRASFFIPLAALSSAIDTPYFFEIDERVSPFFIL